MGATMSIISCRYWPHSLTMQELPNGLQEVGTLPSSSVQQSARWLKSIGPEGTIATIQSMWHPGL